jgi:hypothetical protein
MKTAVASCQMSNLRSTTIFESFIIILHYRISMFKIAICVSRPKSASFSSESRLENRRGQKALYGRGER